MNPKVIKTSEQYEAALAHLETLMDADPDSAAEEELELWSLLIEHYEDDNFPIDPPDPVEAIKFRMDQLGLKPKDLEPYLSRKNRVSEILNHKRPLSLRMIRSLHDGLGIPAEILIR